MQKRKSIKLNAAWNVIKQSCAILFQMITFPYVSRVLGAEIYGKVNFGYSIVNYISLIAALGITNYAIRECSRIKDDKAKLNNMANELFSINLVTTVIAYVILLLLIRFCSKLRGYEALLLIQSTTVIATTIGTDWLNIVFEDYAYIAIRYIICQSIAVLSVLIFVKNENDYLIYATLSVGSSVLANICNVFYVRRYLGVKIRFIHNINLKKHCKPILTMFASAVASLIYINSDITILGLMKNDMEVGYYSVSSKIYMFVKQIVSAAIIVVLPRVSNELVNGTKEHLHQIFQNVWDLLIIICGPACIGLFLLSDNIILLFSGTEYLPAISSLKILAISLPFAILACFYINIIMVPYRMERKVLSATVLSATVNIILNIILIPYGGQRASALTTLIAEILMMLCGIYFTRNIISLHLYKGLKCMILEVLETFIICNMCSRLISKNILQIVSAIILSCLFSGVTVLYIFGRKVKKFQSIPHF